jgi:hypothetical protein
MALHPISRMVSYWSFPVDRLPSEDLWSSVEKLLTALVAVQAYRINTQVLRPCMDEVLVGAVPLPKAPV